MSRCSKRGVGWISLANPQALSGPATSKTLKTQFAGTATAGR